jgi:TrmH family RNA methyltransferase
VIASPRNARVAAAAALARRAVRERERRFLAEGPQAVGEALAEPDVVQELFVEAEVGPRVEELAGVAARMDIPVRTVSPEVMRRLASTVTPQGVVAVARFVDVPLEAALDGTGTVGVLAEVRDPGNAGAIVRSADASGSRAVVLTRHAVDLYNPKSVRASAGSLFHLPVVRDVGLEEAVGALRARGYAVLAADADGERSIWETDLARPTALVFGNEAHGLGPEATARADATVRIPIAGRAESLNLAAAAAIVLFEAARRRSVSEAGLPGIVAGAAHDIRSPLTAVRGFASTLRSRGDRLTQEQRALMIEGIAHDAMRMEMVVAELLDAARLGVGPDALALEVQPVDVLEVARGLAEEVGPWPDLSLDVPGGSVRAAVDRARLRTMLLAIIATLRWWTEEGPVRLSVAAGDGSVEVTLARPGSSIEPGAVDALFLPRLPGSGGGGKIGLFVARQLAMAHGGDLEASSGEDLTFVLRLPVA